MSIARRYGFLPGAQLPSTLYESYKPLYFADQNWKNPNREIYMKALAEHRPVMASVLDWEEEDKLEETMDWAEEASQYAESIMLIPKVIGGINRMPRTVNGKPIILGYSVPTKFGGSPLPLWEYSGWPIHLLGGSPQKQFYVYQHLRQIAEIVSLDGNTASKMATQRCQYWSPYCRYAKNKHWPQLKEDGLGNMKDAPYEAFRRSCENIRAFWDEQDRIG